MNVSTNTIFYLAIFLLAIITIEIAAKVLENPGGDCMVSLDVGRSDMEMFCED